MNDVVEVANQKGGADPDTLFGDSDFAHFSQEKLTTFAGHNFRDSFEAFLQEYEESPVRTLQEMVDFNNDHADECLPPSK
jgi:hypothetical protein